MGAAALLVVLVGFALEVDPPVAFASPGLCGSPGALDPGDISGTVNTYFPATGSAPAGGTSIALGPARGASIAVTPGDRVLVMQMQGATIDSSNTGGYGDGAAGDPATGATTWTPAGTYEYAIAANAVPTGGGTLQLTAGLSSSYVAAAATATDGALRFQVIRVPQYSSPRLTGAVTGAAWNGSSGGVIALDAAGTLDLNGQTIDATAIGFRGGAGRQLGGGLGVALDYRTDSTNAANGSKGEGVAGTPRFVYDGVTTVDTGVEGYPNGSAARGAPANGGGGGTDGNPAANDQNTGGGGGGNGGAGGQGGNAWFSNLATGGFGGASVPGVSPSHIVLGGGGGGGTRNNAGPSDGGNGSGILLVNAGALAGAGTALAAGGAGLSAANDGGGGGGAGGSVAVLVGGGGLGGLSVSAVGGRGGDAWAAQAPGGNPGNRHGPGGGGGGGAVMLSAAAGSVSNGGGANGVTTTANDAFGATPGAGGSQSSFSASELPGAGAGFECVPDMTVTKTTSTPTVVNGPGGTTATYSIAVANAGGRGTAQQVSVSDALPAGFTYQATSSVALAGGAQRPTTANPVAGSAAPSWSAFTIPGGGSVTIVFVVDIAASVAAGTYQNPATAAYLDPARTTSGGTASATYDPASSTGEDVTVTVASVIDAVDDAGSAPSSGGVAVPDVLVNDTLNGAPASLASVTLAQVSSSSAGVSLDVADGSVDVAAGTAAGVYTLTYRICEVGNLSNCDTAVVTVTVTSSGGNPPPPSPPSPPPPAPPAPPAPLPHADLATTLTGPATAVPGSSVQLNAVIRNNGPDVAVTAMATFTLPAGFPPRPGSITIGGRPSGGACRIAGLAIVCALGDLPSGASASVSWTSRVTSSLRPGAYVVQASAVSSTSDPIPANNAASWTITLGRPAPPPAAPRKPVHLRVGKQASPKGVEPGGRIRYRIVVRNTGGVVATRLTVCDRPSANVVFVRAGGATFRRGSACWKMARLGPRASRAFTVIMRVDRGVLQKKLPNYATVTAPRARGKLVARVVVRLLPTRAAGRPGGATG